MNEIDYTEQDLYYYFLTKLTDFSPEKITELLSFYGEPGQIFRRTPETLRKDGLFLTDLEVFSLYSARNRETLEQELKALKSLNLRFVSKENPDYPARLLRTETPPPGLFVKGRLPREDRPSVGIVGSRKCTTYGRESAFFFGKELSKAGVAVISGMAMGIDGAAGNGALSGEGGSFAVLAGGADVCYPRENIGLYRLLSEKGGILSERPAGIPSLPYYFPLRNRIIAGLSDVLLVIEAAPNSGSRITADYALKQGKDVFALPGRVGDRMSEGTNRMIRDGAQILLAPEDVLQYLGMNVHGDTVRRNKVLLRPEEKLVFTAVTDTDGSVEALLSHTGFPFSSLSEILVELEVKGLVKRESIGGYTIVR